jgi:hypothetical protein
MLIFMLKYEFYMKLSIIYFLFNYVNFNWKNFQRENIAQHQRQIKATKDN